MFEFKASFDHKEILRVLARRKLLILLPAVVTVGAAAGGVSLMEPTYLSRSTLAYENPVGLTREVAQAASPRAHRNERARIMARKIESSTFLEQVAVQIGLHEDSDVLDRARRQLAQNPGHDENDLILRQCVFKLQQILDIRAEGGSVFHIIAVSEDPWRAQRVASTVAEQYLQTTQQTQLQSSEEAHTFALEQMAIYEEKVEEKRREIRDYEKQLAIRGVDRSPVTEENVSRVNSLIADAAAELEFVRGRHEIIKSQVAEANLEAFLSLDMISSPKFSALRETLFELEKHLALTMVEYDEGEPPVISAKTQIAVKSQQLLAEAETLARSAFPSVVDEYRQLLVDHEYTEVSLASTEYRKDQLEKFLEKYAQDLTNIPAEEFTLSRLNEELDSAEHLYQTWLEQANSTQIAKAVQAADVGNPLTLIEEARVPLAPFKPDRQRILALAVVLGLVLGIGVAIASEYFDLTLKSTEEIEAALDVAILGTVPRMQATLIFESEERRRRRLRLVVAGMALTGIALAVVSFWYFVLQKGAGG